MSIDAAALKSIFTEIADAIAADKERLCALDGVIGDADHGIAMDLGFSAARDAVAALPGDADPTTVFNTAAKSFLNAVGASSGPLYATAFMRAGATAKGKAYLTDADFVAAFEAMAQGIRDRGKAEPGEKTMVDAWAPAAAAAAEARQHGGTAASAIQAAAKAAAEGAEATKQMVAAKGRSARLGERSIGHMDPGAASTVVVIEAIARGLES